MTNSWNSKRDGKKFSVIAKYIHLFGPIGCPDLSEDYQLRAKSLVVLQVYLLRRHRVKKELKLIREWSNIDVKFANSLYTRRCISAIVVSVYLKIACICFVCHALEINELNQKKFFNLKKNKEYEESLPTPVICPICRAPSMFIVSSTKWIENKVEKALYFAEYKKNTQEIFCPWIRFGQGRCLSTKCEIRGNNLRR
ncbi:hypothetical protein CEXT_736471 [Caerostris extrusa]|uniref:Uncharacterized protein n=1 Tax=Caerostris extrusa TaxID=172846 RepID=A0AAV4MHK3_CAEEX|nr:hypothetical protein CEXT_736471 [Caerostris extrusa]